MSAKSRFKIVEDRLIVFPKVTLKVVECKDPHLYRGVIECKVKDEGHRGDEITFVYGVCVRCLYKHSVS